MSEIKTELQRAKEKYSDKTISYLASHVFLAFSREEVSELRDHIKQLEQELAECKAMMGLKDEVIENYAKAVQAHRRELAEAKEVLSLAKSWTAVQKWDVKGNEEGWNYFVNQLDAAIKESSK